jgi:hypothetical protein
MKCEQPGSEPLNVAVAEPMMLLPPAPGKCRFCAVDHPATGPHNAQSLFYQMRFHQSHGRWPRWSDALAHCGERTTWNWVRELTRIGEWKQEDTDAMNNNTAVAEIP